MKGKKASIAKISPPQITGVLQRKRLFKLLDEKRKKPVVYISGPPGSGKTTLVASYLSERKLPCIWYQIDERDADIATFFHYLGLAAKRIAPHYRKPLPLLTPEFIPGLGAFTQHYFEELCRRLKASAVLVFDNYQNASSESAVHEVMREGSSVLPRGICVILISRTEPPPIFASMRANDTISILGWEDLQLTQEESFGIARLRKQQNREKSSNILIQHLHEQAQGWTAGLVLLLEHANIGSASIHEEGKPTHQSIFDYFAGEIFRKADAATRDLLLKTSFLSEISTHIAYRLTGEIKAGDILSELNRRNYFIFRNMHAESYYYHPLFQKFLISQAQQRLSAEELSQLRLRAARMLEEMGRAEDAVMLYQVIGDWAAMSQLILTMAPHLFAQGRIQTLGDWLTALPSEVVEASPWLLYWRGACYLPFIPREARVDFEKAFLQFDALADQNGLFLSYAGVVNTFVYEWDNFKPLDHWIELLKDLLTRYPKFPSEEIEIRVASAIFIALVYRQPQHSDIAAWAERMEKFLLKVPDINNKIVIGSYLNNYYLWIGDYSKMSALNSLLRPLIRSSTVAPLTFNAWHVMDALYNCQMALTEEAFTAVEAGIERANNTGVHILDFWLFSQGASAALTSSNLSKATKYLERMADSLDHSHRFEVCYYYYLKSFEAYLQENLLSALELAEKSLHLSIEVGSPFNEALARLALTHIFSESKEHAKAEEQLAQVHNIGSGIKSKNVEHRYLLGKAQIALEQGDNTSGLSFLRKAMVLGRKQGYVNYDYWKPSIMAILCAEALKHNIEVEYVQELVRKRNLIPDSPPVEIENWPWPIKIYTMGRFAILKNDKPLRFVSKAQRKPIELLKALLALGGRDVLEEQLTDILWPQADGDAAHIAFATTLKRLRQLIGYKEAIELKEGRLTLNPAYVWVDCWAFERLCSLADAAEKNGQISRAYELCSKAINLYHGHFLGKDEEPWTVSLRERLRGKFLRHIEETGRYLENTGQWENAAEYYQKAIDVDDLEEIFYQRLMLAYQRLGRISDAVSVYQRCCKTLFAIGMKPSATTEAVYRQINEPS